MPFRTVSSARKSVPSLKNLSDKQVKGFISTFNSLLNDGKSESEAIPIAIGAAKKIEKNNMSKIDKALTENIRARLYSALNEKINNEGSLFVVDYDTASSLVYFEIFNPEEGHSTFRVSFSVEEGGVVVGDDVVEVIRTTSYIEKKNEENSLVDKIISSIDKYFGGSSKEHKDIIKSLDEEKKQATHIVYQPDTPDLHGEFMSAETIQKACHSFNQHCRRANLFHKVETDKIDIVESYILPVDATIGETDVSKGTWIAVLQYKDDDLWEMEKSGEIQGISIGARGRKE